MLDMPIKPTLRPFRKYALPDFLWLLTMLHDRPLSEGPGATATAIEIGQREFDRAYGHRVFHGCLTDWEAIPGRRRRSVIALLQKQGIYNAVAPESLAHSLALYPKAPGRWLFAPRIKLGLVPAKDEAEGHLGTLALLAGDSHLPLATHAIFLWIRSLVTTRTLRHDGNPVFTQIMPRYPHAVNDAERSIAETTLRAMFLSGFYQRPEAAQSEAWAQRFWQANLRLFDCCYEQREPNDPPDTEKSNQATESFRKLEHQFLVASQETDCDLWDSDRHDVLTGMTWRSLRIADHMISHPALWSEEHGYASLRALFETWVQMNWMLQVEAKRPTVWSEFKDYGRGRNKQLLLHTRAQAQKAEGRPKELLDGLQEMIEREVNQDQNEDFQAISTAPTFIEGKSLQAMAQEAGLGEFYDGMMIPSSSALHGDWSALDEWFLDRCVHPLHGPHALPRLRPAPESCEKIPFVAEHYATWTLKSYYKAFGYRIPSPSKDRSDASPGGQD